MALIECPNCGKKISDSAEICIHCKYNLKKAKTEEKLKKSFLNIPKDLQKQYEIEFCCSNKTYKRTYKFRVNCRMILLAIAAGGIAALAVMFGFQIAAAALQIDFNSPWTVTTVILMIALFAIEILGLVIILLLRKKEHKNSVIYYVEFSKWLKENKQLELNHIFSNKEKELLKILYPKGVN